MRYLLWFVLFFTCLDGADHQQITHLKPFIVDIQKDKKDNYFFVINGVSYILHKLKDFYWDEKVFSSDNSHIKVQEEFFYPGKILESEKKQKAIQYIHLLEYTNEIVSKTIESIHKKEENKNINEIERLTNDTLSQTLKKQNPNPITVYQCKYGIQVEHIHCNYGKYSLDLSSKAPKLFFNGELLLSKDYLKDTNSTLYIAFAFSKKDALLKLQGYPKLKALMLHKF